MLGLTLHVGRYGVCGIQRRRLDTSNHCIPVYSVAYIWHKTRLTYKPSEVSRQLFWLSGIHLLPTHESQVHDRLNSHLWMLRDLLTWRYYARSLKVEPGRSRPVPPASAAP